MQRAEPTNRILGPLGQRVRALRASRGLTARELASRAGLSPRFLADLEAGSGNISVMRLAGVAEALGTTPSALLSGLTSRPRSRRQVIALLGLRGAGKSTIGALAAERLRLPFNELDSLIEKEAGLSLSELFAVHGESYYRRLERRLLAAFLTEHEDRGAVLATGGGLVTEPRTFRLLRSRCLTVWLKATPEDHWNRVVAQGDRRPMGGDPHAMTELRSILTERSPLYAEAEMVVDTSALGLSDSVTLVVEAARASGGGG